MAAFKAGHGSEPPLFFVSLPNLASDFLQNNLQSTTENVVEASTNPSWRKRGEEVRLSPGGDFVGQLTAADPSLLQP